MSQKELKYSGFSVVPSDYECADGALAASINLIAEDNQLKPLPNPDIICKYIPGKVIFIHKNSAYLHYIVLHQNGKDIFWFDPDDIYNDTLLNPQTLISQNHICSVTSEAPLISSVGNTLVVLDGKSMQYILWKGATSRWSDPKYVCLGSHIPEPKIEFALGANVYNSDFKNFDFSLQLEEEYKNYIFSRWNIDNSSSGRLEPGWSLGMRGNNYNELYKNVSSYVFAEINKFLAECAANKEFTEPFFIRYALRLYDGSHTLHSAPILMIPNSRQPLVAFSVYQPSEGGNVGIRGTIYHHHLNLFYKITQAIPSDWHDIVTHIDFFISTPIYTFNQAGEVDPILRGTDYNDSLLKFSHFGEVYSESGGLVPQNALKPETPYQFLLGNYPLYYDDISSIPPRFMDLNPGALSAEDIEEKFSSPLASLFYKVASIDINKAASSPYFFYFDWDASSLTNIQTRPQLQDDYQSHHSLIPSYAYDYNARLNISGINLLPFPGFDLRSQSQFFSPASPASAKNKTVIYTRLVRNEVAVWCVDENILVDIEAPLSSSNFPRWFFYPDSNAVQMFIVEYNSQGGMIGYWNLPLKSHDSLEGAYWCRGLTDSLPEFTRTSFLILEDFRTAEMDTSIPLPNKIYTSEVNNPFLFPLNGIVTVGTGKISAICSAARPLSQGQFGQFPLYAFTDEGIWALEVSNTGTYSARQPITRDVCINPDSITSIDSAVLFATDRGIMLISGSNTSCISEPINSEFPFDISILQAMDKLHAMMGHEDDTCFPLKPFSEFLLGCKMIYDYVHQRIILFNPSISYAYIYSLKSKEWGLSFSKIKSVVNAYPEALAMDLDGNLISFSSPLINTSNSQLAVSRPFKLDAPDTFKTIDTIIQRGYFRKGHVKTVLYGSRDLFSWHLIWSSQDHYLRGFRGTPYKYFRVALLCNLSADESIYGATVQFTPRLMNCPR